MSIQKDRGKKEAEASYLYLDQVTVSIDSYMDDFRTHLLPVIKPSWKDTELDSRVFDSGLTNTLVAIFDKHKGLKKSREDVILLRMNGIRTEKIISRADELVCLTTSQDWAVPTYLCSSGEWVVLWLFPRARAEGV